MATNPNMDLEYQEELKICQICDGLVTDPVFCHICGIHVHPACVTLTIHPQEGGKFIDCKPTSDETISPTDQAMLNNLKEIFAREFSKFRQDFESVYKEQFQKMNQRLSSLSIKVSKYESIINRYVDVDTSDDS